MNTAGVYRSEEGRQKVLAYYRQVLRVLPFGQRYVETSYGKTFLLEAGAHENPAVLLLHGSCSNSAFWFGEILALAERFHVFAADLIGEAGNSAEQRLDLRSDAYALWMGEVLDTLSVPKAAVIGNSLGGYLALKFATAFPARTTKLVLIGASGITPPRPSFLEQTRNFAEGEGAGPLQFEAVSGEVSLPQEVLDFIRLILEHFIPITDSLPLIEDEQLGRLTMPVFFIAGEEDVTMEPAEAAARLSDLVPQTEVRLIKSCRHVVPNAAEQFMPFLLKEG